MDTAEKILFDEYIFYLKESNCYPEKDYLTKKYRHSIYAVECAGKIYGELNKEEKCAILLHDIGCFAAAFQRNKNHAELGYEIISENPDISISVALAVRYHENDNDWNQKIIEYCSEKKYDGVIESTAIEIIKKIIDADIIANLESSLKLFGSENNCLEINQELIHFYLNNQLPDMSMVNNNSDYIIYMICGLKLINSMKTIEYIKQSGIIDRINIIIETIKTYTEDNKKVELIEAFQRKIYEQYSI